MRRSLVLSLVILLSSATFSKAQTTTSLGPAEHAHGYVSAGAGFSSKGISLAGDVVFSLQDSPWQVGVNIRRDIEEFIFTEDYVQWVGIVALHAWSSSKYYVTVGGGLGQVTGMREVDTIDPDSWTCFLGCPSEKIPSSLGGLLRIDALVHSSWLGLGIQPYLMVGPELVTGATIKLLVGKF